MHPLLQRLRPILAPRKSRREEFGRLVLRNISAIRAWSGEYYRTWIKQNEPDDRELENQKDKARSLPHQPLISLIGVVTAPTARNLHDMIRSVRSQSYENWELCLAFEASAPSGTQQILNSYTLQDRRIKVIAVPAKRDNAENINDAIEMARGEFIGFVDQNDCLAPFALYAIVEALNQYPETDVFYSDEDQLSADGKKRSNPQFKPAFSIDYLHGYDYIREFLVLRRSLCTQTGGLRSGFDGAPFYDLSLRTVELASQVTHIPQVLYHNRQTPERIKDSKDKRKLTSDARQRALHDHFNRRGIKARIEEGKTPKICRVRYEIPDAPLISIIIPNHEHAVELRQCVNSILELSTYTHYEIVIVENNSQEPETLALYQELQQRDQRVRIVEYHHQPFNYSTINNYAVSMSRGEILLFLNNDTQTITPDWLENLLEYALRPDVGAVGARLYFPNMLIQHTGVIIGLGAGAGHYFVGYPKDHPGYGNNLQVPINLSAVTAACLMMRREVFDEVGGFGEKYRLAFGDIDLCLKVRQKELLVVCTPYAELIHYESMTRGFDDADDNATRFSSEAALLLEEWADFFTQGDPYYNPNLTLSRGDYSLRAGKCPQQPRTTRGGVTRK